MGDGTVARAFHEATKHHAAITEAIVTVANKIASDPIYRHPRKGSDPVQHRPDQSPPE